MKFNYGVFTLSLLNMLLISCTSNIDLKIDEGFSPPFNVDFVNRTANAHVTNVGSAPSGDFLVYFTLNRLNPAPGQDDAIYNSGTYNLGPGESVNVFANFSDFHSRIEIVNLMAAQFVIRIDAKGTVAESNETNNVIIMDF